MTRDRVFISYRRSDSSQAATSLRLSLIGRFGESAVFQDVSGIPIGDSFPERLRAELDRAAVVVAVVGEKWLTAADQWGRRRLDDPADWVHVELAEALVCPDVVLIPLVVDGASFPSPSEAELGALPESLRALSARLALRVDNASWDRDIEVLLDRIAVVLGDDRLTPMRTAGPSSVVPRQVPHQLPGVPGRFVGRAADLDILTRSLRESRAEDRPGGGGTAAIFGGAGIGKTTLALQWSHRFAGEFPDGQLYVNLRGFDAVDPPLEPATAVRAFLGAFGLSSEGIPGTFEEQTALYRTLLWDRWVLVVLDNARDESQVYPLLPGKGFVVVTSRNTLRGLIADGAQPVTLDLLGESEAIQLLTRHVGDRRAGEEPEALRDLVTLTAGLPLAVAVVGSRASLNESIPLSALASDLRAQPDLLDALEAGDISISVQSLFSWSYRALTPNAARLFRLVGLHPGPDIGARAAAALSGVSADELGPRLDELTRTHFLQEFRAGRFRSHDLLQAYAAKMAGTQDSDDERRAAYRRVFDYYLHTAFSADRQLYPYRHPIELGPPAASVVPTVIGDAAEANRWFEEEIETLLAVSAFAATHGFLTHAWQLPWTFATYLHRSGGWHDYAASQQGALEVAVELDDPVVRARVERNVGRPHTLLGRPEEAVGHYERSLELCRQTSDRHGEALCEDALTWQYGRISRHADAVVHAERALALWAALGNDAGRARALNYIGWNRSRLGDYDAALAPCEESLRLFGELGNEVGEADVTDSLGYVYRGLGRASSAIGSYLRSVELWRRLGDRYNEADVLDRLGDVYADDGRHENARAAWRAAVEILEDLALPVAGAVRAKLGMSADDPV